MGGPDRGFPATSWGLLRGARNADPEDRRRHLERLVAVYWKPVYAAIRQGWGRSNEEAKDLTQEFFATEILEGSLLANFRPDRGGFRAFLRGALSNFMGHAVRDAARLKRGGGARLLSLEMDEAGLEGTIPDPRGLTPEEIFDRAWARTVLTEALRRTERRLREEGQARAFELFRRYDLEGNGGTYADLGRSFGLGLDTVKNLLTLARREFRRAAAEVVGDTVETAEELAAELQRLFASP